MNNEIWKPVKGFENNYEISNKGNIRNKKGLNMKTRTNNRGYHMLELVDDSLVVHTCLLHRLVANTFLEDTGVNPDGTLMKGRHQVNHKDGNKDRNLSENLEWCDQSYNMREAYRLGLREYVPHEVSNEYLEKMRKVSSRPSPGKEVQMLDKDTLAVLETFENSFEAVKKHPELNLKDSGIRDAANHRRGIETYKGYRWQFTGKITNGNKCRESKK